MPPRRLYMDNASTSFPKPKGVGEAMADFALRVGASAGRGAYAEAGEAGEIVSRCRENVRRLFNGERVEHVIFTANCSDSLNTAIKGMVDPRAGGHVICTETDHNSILRPITAMADYGWIEFTRVRVDGAGLIDPDDIKRAIRPDTKLVAMTHASNVTGAVQDARAIGKLCREHAVPFMLDAAQSAGQLPIDVQADCVDLLAAPGHKSLMGPLGTGVLYVRPGLERTLRPLREGGTGSQSDEPRHPTAMPDRYEAGSHNAVGLAGLNAGVEWVLEQGIDALAARQAKLVGTFVEGAIGVEGLRYYGPQGVRDRIGVFSIQIDGIAPGDLAARLEREYGILSRAGMHCASLVHQRVGSAAFGGTARLSFGPFLSRMDVKYATDALAEIALGEGAGVKESSQAGV